MTEILFAITAGVGVWLLATRRPEGGGQGRAPGAPARPTLAQRSERWLTQAGLAEVRLSEFAAVMVAAFVLVSALVFAVFGAAFPALVLGTFAATGPLASHRSRRRDRLATAQDAWPRMIEEIRIQASSLGRSVPQALFEVGRRGPAELRPAFAAAQREWLMTTDFERCTRVLKERLADPTADAACETLLIAHELGGADLDRRLDALIEDRILDLQGRKDARAKQSGVRFARRFVLLVPLGMAVAGMSIGDGRSAYQTPTGQLLVLAGIGMVVGCWIWAGRLMAVPEEQRVFVE